MRCASASTRAATSAAAAATRTSAGSAPPTACTCRRCGVAPHAWRNRTGRPGHRGRLFRSQVASATASRMRHCWPELRSGCSSSTAIALAPSCRRQALPAPSTQPRRIHERRNGGAVKCYAGQVRNSIHPCTLLPVARDAARGAFLKVPICVVAKPSWKADWNRQGCRLLRLGACRGHGVLRHLGTGQLLSIDWKQPAPSRRGPRSSPAGAFRPAGGPQETDSGCTQAPIDRSSGQTTPADCHTSVPGHETMTALLTGRRFAR